MVTNLPPPPRASVASTILLLCLFQPAAGQEEPTNARIDAILAAMAAQREGFDAGQLHDMGPGGLAALLDRLLPDTAQSKDLGFSEEAVTELIERLGHDSYAAREAASAELVELGSAARPYLLKAVRHTDAEISWRARRILRRWQAVKIEDKSPYAPAFEVYTRGIEDDARLRELARRVLAALEAGMPNGGRYKILRACIAAVARSQQDQYIDLFEPLLDHQNVQVAQWMVETVGTSSHETFCPRLMLDALADDRKEVVQQAITRIPICRDASRTTEFKRQLLVLFDGDDESLKFLACHRLTTDYEHGPATAYLLEQAQSKDRTRAHRALAWLGDSRNLGKPASAELLDGLTPLLRSRDHQTRRLALGALAMHSGEEVVRRLIPLLGSTNASMATEVGYRLQHQHDKKMLRRLLAAAKDDPNEQVRKKAAAIVEKLDQKEVKP